MYRPGVTAPGLDSSAGSLVTAAIEKVFGTVELLESILVHLPMKDILRAQRVARQWRAVIEGSLMLQKKLFFVAGGFRDRIQSPSDVIVAPYLASPDLRFSKTVVFAGIGALFSRFPSNKPSNTQVNFSSPDSWEKMLICQPAVCKAQIVCSVRHPKTLRRPFEVSDVVAQAVENENGITGADIVAAIAQIRKQWEWRGLCGIRF